MSIEEQVPYAFTRTLAQPFAEALQRLREAVVAENLQLLYELDVGTPDRPCHVLGVGDARLTQKAFDTEPNVGLLLPLQVVLRAAPDPQASLLALVDPVVLLALTNNPEVTLVAWELRRRLEQVRDRVAATASPQAALGAGVVPTPRSA